MPASKFRMLVTPNATEIDLFGDVGWEITAKDFIAQLRGVPTDKPIRLNINSPGGDVVDGFAIFNALANHPAPKTAYVLGWAASMASIIAMAADNVVMPENAWLMIHNPWTMAVGDADTLRHMADVLTGMEAAAVRAYKRHSKLPDEDIQQLMDDETWMDGAQAFEMGFATQLEKPIAAAASAIKPTADYRHLPQAAAQLVGMTMPNETPITTDSAPAAVAEPVVPPVVETPDPAVVAKCDEAYATGLAAGKVEGEAEGMAKSAARIEEMANAHKTALAAKDAELVAVRAELATAKTAVARANEHIKALTASTGTLQTKLDALTAGLTTPDDPAEAPADWKAAVDRLMKTGLSFDDAYDQAREAHPELWAAFYPQTSAQKA